MVSYKGPPDDFKTPTKWWLWLVAILIMTSVIFGAFKFIAKPFQVIDKVTDPDHIINSYEEYEEIYAAALSSCEQIAALEASEKETSGGFDREDRIIALRAKLTRWVTEYNAKSRMITRNNWKSSDLPYSITSSSICK